MVQQTNERERLYTRQQPAGEPIPINVEPAEVRDDQPGDDEIRTAVRKLSQGRAGGASKMRAEDIKDWLQGIVQEEDTGMEGAGDNWRLLVKLIQAIWEKGEIPTQMRWVIVILIPKGRGEFRGIGLLEPMWKVIENIMDGRLQAIELHDCLHGFMTGRGTGTATIEAKLNQQLAFLEQTPLYQIFVDLKKAYDSVDRSRCPDIMAGYGVGPNFIRLHPFLVINRNGVQSRRVFRASAFPDGEGRDTRRTSLTADIQHNSRRSTTGMATRWTGDAGGDRRDDQIHSNVPAGILCR